MKPLERQGTLPACAQNKTLQRQACLKPPRCLFFCNFFFAPESVIPTFASISSSMRKVVDVVVCQALHQEVSRI